MSAQLNQWKSNFHVEEAKHESLRKKVEERESEMGEKKVEMTSFQAQLSTLKSKWSAAETSMAEAKCRADDNLKTIRVLEGENATILQKWTDATTSLDKVQMIAERCQNLEDENATFRQRIDDLLANQIEMSKEVNDAQGLASNTERLHNMMTENERYITKLQSAARASHLESLQKTFLDEVIKYS
mmetsp:Transcript_5172/g.8146  ORF Transcript_5172/g.8146 Transcript_5172/m.8146 type:complete len:186 (-) Transcript_5172:108-665(-)